MGHRQSVCGDFSKVCGHFNISVLLPHIIVAKSTTTKSEEHTAGSSGKLQGAAILCDVHVTYRTRPGGSRLVCIFSILHSNLLNPTKPAMCKYASIKCLSSHQVLISSYQQPRHAPRRTPVAIRRPWWPLMARMDSLIQIHLHRDYIHDTEIDLLSPFP